MPRIPPKISERKEAEDMICFFLLDLWTYSALVETARSQSARHSVMLVGMPFSGKTTALNTLQKSLSDLAQAFGCRFGDFL